MVEYKNNNPEKLNLIFHALSDQTRRDLLHKITDSPKRVTDIASTYDISLNAVSKHLKVLEKAGLVVRKVEGRTHYCQTNPQELKAVQSWIRQYEKFWTEKLDALEKFVIKKDKSRRKK